jgi:hypothetical protein
MKKIKEYKAIITLVLVIILGAFYWFELRPNQIRKNCWQKIENLKIGEKEDKTFNQDEFLIKYGIQESMEKVYTNCLKEKGLKI